MDLLLDEHLSVVRSAPEADRSDDCGRGFPPHRCAATRQPCKAHVTRAAADRRPQLAAAEESGVYGMLAGEARWTFLVYCTNPVPVTLAGWRELPAVGEGRIHVARPAVRLV
jgi:hypothetical protein